MLEQMAQASEAQSQEEGEEKVLVLDLPTAPMDVTRSGAAAEGAVHHGEEPSGGVEGAGGQEESEEEEGEEEQMTEEQYWALALSTPEELDAMMAAPSTVAPLVSAPAAAAALAAAEVAADGGLYSQNRGGLLALAAHMERVGGLEGLGMTSTGDAIELDEHGGYGSGS